ncbi:MAG: ribonuclease H-like domain-containing protein [Planctomycetota bacterium]
MRRVSHDALKRHLDESLARLDRADPYYFAERLPNAQQWRLFPDFRHRVAYLDIETTGLSGDFDEVTTIAIYDGQAIHTYIQGENLERFPKDIRHYDVLVTYNGKCFDVPFLEAFFRMKLPQVHLDLRYILKRLGFTGGLKGCERKLGLHRGALEGVDGFMAVLLWGEYKNEASARALDTLLCYNVQDVLSLEVLLVKAFNLLVGATPFARECTLEVPVQPENPFPADVKIVRRLMKRVPWHYEDETRPSGFGRAL